MKILAVIIASPIRKVSGASRAGEQLSAATAEHVSLELAIMWDATVVDSVGPMTRRYVASTSLLGPLARFTPRTIRTPLYDSAIPRLIRPGRYDLVHIHNLIPTFAALRVARACRRAGIPYVISTHGFFEITRYSEINGFGPIRRALIDVVMTRPFHRVVRGAARLLALSDREADMLGSLGVGADRTDLVTNGVDEFYLDDPSPEEIEDARRRWAPSDRPILLFMGSLHGYKGVGTFLSSLTRLDHDFQAVVAGRFNDPEQPDRLLAAAGLTAVQRARVVFTGEVTDGELRALYTAADVFVYPTNGDTLPLVVLEAMACRCPIVSTVVGGVPFEVTDDVGVLVPPNDPAAVSVAVAGLLADPEGRRAAGSAARRRVQGVFRWSQSGLAAVAAYERAVGAAGAGTASDAPTR